MKPPSESPATPEIACSVEGGCPPSHRVARRISSAIVALLVVALVVCGAYLWWSQSL